MFELQEIGFIHEVLSDHKSEAITYQPSVDISQLTVSNLLEEIDQFGSEDFKVDNEEEFGSQWATLIDARKKYLADTSKILIKDL